MTPPRESTLTPNPTERLAALSTSCTTNDALAFFDDLPIVEVEDMIGRWIGTELATGHVIDGILHASGWYGKQFDGPDAAHPLLFSSRSGAVYRVDPRKIPMAMAAHIPIAIVKAGGRMLAVVRACVRTRKPRARLRALEYRGKVSAAMIYDHRPIIDSFRRIDADTVLGAMDQRGIDQPYFFVLRREG